MTTVRTTYNLLLTTYCLPPTTYHTLTLTLTLTLTRARTLTLTTDYLRQATIAVQPDDDAAIAKVAREFAALARDAPAAAGSGTAAYRVKSEALQYECGVEVSL